MKRKSSAAEWLLLTVLPALLLLTGSTYLMLTDLLRMPPYLMFCLSGLLVLTGCLIWGSSLCCSMLRSASRVATVLLTALLTLCAVLYYFSGLRGATLGHAAELTVVTALPALVPALLFLVLDTPRCSTGRKSAAPTFRALLFIGIAAAAFALTDPLHHLVFPENRASAFGSGMTFLIGWLAVGMLFVQIRLLVVRSASLPVTLLYSLLLAAESAVFFCMTPAVPDVSPLILSYLLPLTVFLSCTLAQITGLLPDGSGWPELLRVSALPVQLMGRDGTILYGADCAIPVTATQSAQILEGRQQPVFPADRSFRMDPAPIHGGFVLYQRDLKDLRTLQTALDEASHALDEAKTLLSRQEELLEKCARLEEKNAFLAEQECKLHSRTEQASALLQEAADSELSQEVRRATLARANFFTVYVARLSAMLAPDSAELSVSALTEALAASAEAAAAVGLRCRLLHVAQGNYPAAPVLALYELSQQILENALSAGLSELDFHLRNEQSGLRLSVSLSDSAEEDPLCFRSALTPYTESHGGAAELIAGSDSRTLRFDFFAGGAAHV